MKDKISTLLCFLVFFTGTSYAFASDIENGEQLFAANCSACHLGGKNVVVPEKNLQSDVLQANGMKSVDAITYQVTNGKNAMPAFGGRLDDQNIKDIAEYVISQSTKGWT